MAISAKKFRNDLKKSGIFYTDAALAREIRALLPDDVPEAYDPTCGDGSLLKAFPDSVRKYGQDVLAEQVAEARQTLVNFEGVVGDTLLEPAFKGRKFKAIVGNPPFSVKWDPDALAEDERFSAAPCLPLRSKADYAFILHILHYLAEDGVAAVLNFPGILYRGQREGKIREWIVRNNWIEKVIHIPGGHFEDTQIATALLVLRKNRASADIEFIDTEHGISRMVPFSEVEENNFILSVSTYVQPETEKEELDPLQLQSNARSAFIKSLEKELDVDWMICEIESSGGRTGPLFDFRAYLLEIRGVVDRYLAKAERAVS